MAGGEEVPVAHLLARQQSVARDHHRHPRPARVDRPRAHAVFGQHVVDVHRAGAALDGGSGVGRRRRIGFGELPLVFEDEHAGHRRGLEEPHPVQDRRMEQGRFRRPFYRERRAAAAAVDVDADVHPDPPRHVEHRPEVDLARVEQRRVGLGLMAGALHAAAQGRPVPVVAPLVPDLVRRDARLREGRVAIELHGTEHARAAVVRRVVEHGEVAETPDRIPHVAVERAVRRHVMLARHERDGIVLVPEIPVEPPRRGPQILAVAPVGQPAVAEVRDDEVDDVARVLRAGVDAPHFRRRHVQRRHVQPEVERLVVFVVVVGFIGRGRRREGQLSEVDPRAIEAAPVRADRVPEIGAVPRRVEDADQPAGQGRGAHAAPRLAHGVVGAARPPFEREGRHVAGHQETVERQPAGVVGAQQPRVLVVPERPAVRRLRVGHAHRAGRREPEPQLPREDGGRGARERRRFPRVRRQRQRRVPGGRLRGGGRGRRGADGQDGDAGDGLQIARHAALTPRRTGRRAAPGPAPR